MPFGGRPHDRGLPAPRLGDVHVGAIEHELAYRIEIAGAGRDHHGRLAVPSRRARIGARLQQALDDFVVAVGGGERQGRLSVLVDDIHVRAGREQRLGHRALPEVHGPRQRRGAIRLSRVDVGFRADQRGERLLIASLYRFEHAEVFGGRVLRDGRSSHQRRQDQRQPDNYGPPQGPAEAGHYRCSHHSRTGRTASHPLHLLHPLHPTRAPSTVPCCLRSRRQQARLPRRTC